MPATGGVVATNRILVGHEFSNGIEPFASKGNSAVLRWKQGNQRFVRDFPSMDTSELEDALVTVVLLIGDGGHVTAHFKQ